MAVVTVRHLRLERLLAIESALEARRALCAIVEQAAQDALTGRIYRRRGDELLRVETLLASYRYLIRREWDRIQGTNASSALRVAFRDKRTST
jgi:hypothetical protein